MTSTGVMFVDCPAYLDQHGTAGCGLPAVVESRYTFSSTEGLLDSVTIRCPRGHWFNVPIQALTDRPPARPAHPHH